MKSMALEREHSKVLLLTNSNSTESLEFFGEKSMFALPKLDEINAKEQVMEKRRKREARRDKTSVAASLMNFSVPRYMTLE